MTSDVFPSKLKLGVSSCLLGEKVRYDGAHCYDEFINHKLARFFDFVPFCPETGAGLGVPRPALCLMTQADGLRARGIKDPTLDVTDRLADYLPAVQARLAEIAGYILKKNSPSCGLERVKVFQPGGPAQRNGMGIFAAALRRAYPLLPLEEEGRLHDPSLRENFISRVFVYQRWQNLLADGLTPRKLVDFHRRHKLLVMAHNQSAYRRLGQLVAKAGGQNLNALALNYGTELMHALQRRATQQSHSNVLQHIQGYLKKSLDMGDKAELLDIIDHYRRGELPLIVPIMLLRHHLRKHPSPYLAEQIYFAPYPAELGLRNSI